LPYADRHAGYDTALRFLIVLAAQLERVGRTLRMGVLPSR
jgi:hypothetical protein